MTKPIGYIIIRGNSIPLYKIGSNGSDSKINMRKILKTTSIALFTVAFLAASAAVPFLSGANAGATKQPNYSLKVRNVTDGATFDGNANSVTLDKGEVAQLRMQVGNLEEDNDISSLRFKAFFTDKVNPTQFNADIKADELSWVGGQVAVNVPEGSYLKYVSGTTVFDVDDRPEFFTRTNVPDINGTSPLAFNNGYQLTNVKSGPHTWIWMYFNVKVVDIKPVVINPRLDMIKYVANLSDGEDFADKKTTTTVDPGETIAVQIVVKNGVAESTLHSVVLSDQKPAGNATPQSLTATAKADEASTNKLIKININETQELNVIFGSVVLKDLFGNTIKILSQDEVNKLFGKGLALGDINGTFEFAKVIEYKAKSSEVKSVTTVTTLPDTGPGLGLILLLGTVPAGIAIRKLRNVI